MIVVRSTLAFVLFLLPAGSSIAQIPVAPPLNPAPQSVVSARQDAVASSMMVYSTADPATYDPRPLVTGPTPGYAIVREVRHITLTNGINSVEYVDVPAAIDPTTVTFRSLTAGDLTSVLEQSFAYDVAVPEKMLQRYVGQTILINRKVPREEKPETKEGRLLSYDQSHLVIETRNKQMPIEMVPRNGDITEIKLFNVPGRVVTKPTLYWKLEAKRPGPQDIQVGYRTDGLTWRADYNVVLNKDGTGADISAWASVVNATGTTFSDTRLKLVAGDIQRLARGAEATPPAPAGDYHLYTLPGATTLPSDSTKQIQLFAPRSNIGVTRSFVYTGGSNEARRFARAEPATERDFGTRSASHVDVYLRLKNTQQNGLGQALPAGRVRVYQADETDSEFIGEDVVGHTPADSEIVARIGSAFDMTVERTQSEFQMDPNGRAITESFEITVHNQKKEAVNVVVREPLYRWSNWTIVKKSDEFQKQSDRTVEFPVEAPAGGEKKLTYTVKYTW